MAREFVQAALPAYFCPPDTKMRLLNLGTLNVDEGWLIVGKNGGSASNPNPRNQRRDLMIIAGLIEHPEIGLVLFETGCTEDTRESWGSEAVDLFPRTVYEKQNRLPEAIKAAGYDIKDVSAIVMGHMHLDHAGGLEHFRNTNVPIYVHEEEFKHACWATATKQDDGLYLADYILLDGSLRWEIFSGNQYELCTGITLYHCPGHTPGLCIMQVNLKHDGTFIWTTDQYHIRENFEDKQHHGWLVRDYLDWVRSDQFIRRLQRIYSAKLIFGHDFEIAEALIKEKDFFH